MYTVIVCFPVFDVINTEINLHFDQPIFLDDQKGFLMISGGIVVDPFAYIRLILEAKCGDDPLVRKGYYNYFFFSKYFLRFSEGLEFLQKRFLTKLFAFRIHSNYKSIFFTTLCNVSMKYFMYVSKRYS